MESVKTRPVGQVIDPLKFIAKCWPDVRLYDKQRDVLYSLRDNDETVVPAGNELGKTFIAALGILWFFMSRYPCRIVTTSVDATQLNAVLWGEIRRFIQTSAVPLSEADGGPLIVNDQKIRRLYKGKECGLSYILGRVATQEGEGMSGHHIANTGDGIPRTLFVPDESSGVPQIYYEKADSWADRKLILGNPYDCNNFFRWAVEGNPATEDRGGDLLRDYGPGYYRKIIRIKAEDSPNVVQAISLLREQGSGEENQRLAMELPLVLEGVKDYQTYVKHRKLWDIVKQCICLDAAFYKGGQLLLYPPTWLDRAERIAAGLPSKGSRKAKAMGIDPAEGGDSTAWSVADEYGLIHQLSIKTPDTTVITSQTLALMQEYGVPAEKVFFDSGGGGKAHADRLRLQGYNVRTVAFGESVTPELKRHRVVTPLKDRKEAREERYVYKNRRTEMYGLLSLLLDPVNEGFGLPREYAELRRQLAPVPRKYDGEGRLYLPPKNKRDRNSKEQTMTELIGCSPDEADSLVLAVYGMASVDNPIMAGAI